ncbi:hypothetical protein NDU88_003479 [Pleurodeles waltl]|uniref:Uncharacterized protein n=1 Tax=Pleurodeles waltl TaxID=8319 RepID=A0AAV7V1V8_PLEWA|nr:hypothetical protein NDU88_003479 [Pleurodeles waltl]
MCGNSFGMSGSREQTSTSQPMVTTATVEVLVRVGAPLKHQSEVRANSGVNGLTLSELAGVVLESENREVIDEQPSTNWEAAIFEGFTKRKGEMLDYKDDQEIEKGEIVDELVGNKVEHEVNEKSGLMTNEERSIGILQMVVTKRDLERRREMRLPAGRFIPRGEKKGWSRV